MKPRPYLLTSAILFGLVCLAHVTRLFHAWPVELAGRVVPWWASWPGFLIAGALSAWGFLLAARAKG
jgi:hypothetical protein